MEKMSLATASMDEATSAFTALVSIFTSEQGHKVVTDAERRRGNFKAMFDQLSRGCKLMMLNDELRFQLIMVIGLDNPDVAEKAMASFLVMVKDMKEMISDAAGEARKFLENGNA